jgi:hypothetical protein
MKKGICLVLVVIVLFITDALPRYAKGHGHGADTGMDITCGRTLLF